MKFTRVFAMPNRATFKINPIKKFVNNYISKGTKILDPFSGDSQITPFSNDINPKSLANYHLDAIIFLDLMCSLGEKFDLILFDPPYSPTQISRCYNECGRLVSMEDTQNGSLYRKCRDKIKRIAYKDAVVLSFGWNSVGMGKDWEILEILLVCHGGAHNDTICVAQKLQIH